MNLRLSVMAIILLINMSLRPVIIISLGHACTVASALRENGLRTTAYPFDWIVTPFRGLYQALQDNFIHLLEENSLTIRSYDRYGLVDYYGFEYVHDFPADRPNDAIAELIGEGHVTGGIICNNWRDFLLPVKEKYQRRIERLVTTLKGHEKVYLLRYGSINKSEAIQLRNFLYKKYPLLDFILIVLGNSPDIQLPWHLDKIKNFYLDDKEPQQWKNLFMHLGFINN